ncbi:hypothetical protein [Streptomyces sp. NBC_01483]|uniref:hypothetical protein n=1 Tax=Streptomyces sp. NBC_01483 TaxID=2903883 RepID=UPI002E325E14|nr:hypothetical protein [Streptomyces sp. NBC_01483]
MSWGEGSMNWAELRDLVDALPEDSATRAAAAGDVEGRRWSQQTFLLATQANLLQMAVRILWTAHLKGSPPDMPPVEPPKLEDEQHDELAEARAARNEALLDSFRPQQAPADTAQRKADVDHWLSKIRELEAARQ